MRWRRGSNFASAEGAARSRRKPLNLYLSICALNFFDLVEAGEVVRRMLRVKNAEGQVLRVVLSLPMRCKAHAAAPCGGRIRLSAGIASPTYLPLVFHINA
jgi:hypothetical protein